MHVSASARWQCRNLLINNNCPSPLRGGHPSQEVNMTRMLNAMLLGAVIVISMSGCMSTPVPGKAGESFRDYDKAFDARQIYRAFATNRLAAQWEYSGKICKGFGRVWKAESEGELHRIYFEIGDPMQSRTQKVQSVCIELTTTELNRLPSDVRPNDIIWVEGTVSRYEKGAIVLRNIRRYKLRDRIMNRRERWRLLDNPIDPRLYKPKTEVGEPKPVD